MGYGSGLLTNINQEQDLAFSKALYSVKVVGIHDTDQCFIFKTIFYYIMEQKCH